MEQQRKKKSRIKIVVAIVLMIAVIIVIGCAVYVNDYYHADASAFSVINAKTDAVSVEETENKRIVFKPDNPIAGFIFYPGGKVEYESYSPLMEALAKERILCVLVHMPGNLAVLDMNAADGIRDEYPEVKNWYIGGHSLGGSMAASYVSKHTDEYQGLILLAAYSTADLSGSELGVLSVYGTEDEVLNRKSYEKYISNLPSDYTEVEIEGGCHGYFGSYGPQDGDGVPSITREEQVDQTVSAITDMIAEH